jgi:HEAT repeat protein
MINEDLPMTMDLQQKLIFFTLLIFCLSSCAPKKVWYQEDIQDSMMKSDLEACRSGMGDEEELALCMRSRGYLQIPQPQAELLAVRSLQEEGLTADEIAERLQWSKNKVLRYLDEDYQLPATASLGRQPVEITTKIGKPAVNPLIADLRDKDPLVRSQAVQALGVIGDPRAVEPLIVVLNDKNPLIQRQAIKALGRIKDQRAVGPLIVVLIDSDRKPHVRMSAAEVLGMIGDDSAVDSLIAALHDGHWEVRAHAAEALGRIKDPRAVEPLIETLKDQDATVRGNAVDGLAKIKDPRAIEPLAVTLTDKSRIVRKKAARALTAIAGEDISER